MLTHRFITSLHTLRYIRYAASSIFLSISYSILKHISKLAISDNRLREVQEKETICVNEQANLVDLVWALGVIFESDN